MFSANNSTVYYDKIEELLEKYINSFQTSIKMMPAKVNEIKNSRQAFANLYSGELHKQKKQPKFWIGNRVCISKFERKIFDKGFTINWTEEIFVIDKILNTKPITFHLANLQGEAVTGSFYEQEIQRTTQQVFRIEKVIRHDNKRKLALVKWQGYPDKFNLWVPMNELSKLKWIESNILLEMWYIHGHILRCRQSTRHVSCSNSRKSSWVSYV